VKLPNWLKVVWWLLLTGVLSYYLHQRYPDLSEGRAVPSDIVVFVIWIALLLAPLFSELSLLGITLKQHAEEMKSFVASQANEIRSEVRNAVDVRTTFSPQFNIPAPVADSQLPELEARIKEAVSNAFLSHGILAPTPAQVDAPNDVLTLFATRYSLEKELRRIGGAHVVSDGVRSPVLVTSIVRGLVQARILEPQLAQAVKELYSVCSPAIHGEDVTEAQLSFVKEVGPKLIATLKEVL